MAAAQDNEILTRVSAGTPMGDLMRQYWIPAAKSAELKTDGDPVRLKLLGEQLIAFRDSSGKVGIMDHRCPHRCASLFFGRNEEGGIRCVYHGWKFDADGNCTDMANVPPHQDFKHKVHAKAYKTAERNGLVWVFMGDQNKIPELPPFEANLLPEGEVNIWFVMRECSWLQGLEGDMDTTHLGFLHYGLLKGTDFEASAAQRYTAVNKTPEFVTKTTDWGYMYAAIRGDGSDEVHMRVSQFVMPFWTMPPVNPITKNYIARAWVPMDDTHHMFVHIVHKDYDPLSRKLLDGRSAGFKLGFDYLPNTTDWYGRYNLRPNMANDFLIDREKQRTESFTGIDGITLQDFAVVESMGAIVDRTMEHLASSDAAIAQTRRVLINAANNLKEGNRHPSMDRQAAQVPHVRGGFFQAPKGGDWQKLYAEQIERAPFSPTNQQAAE